MMLFSEYSFCIKRVEWQISIVTFVRRLLDVSRVKFGEFFYSWFPGVSKKAKKTSVTTAFADLPVTGI